MAETFSVSDNLLKSLLDVQIQMYDQLQLRVNQARKSLIGLLEALAPGEVDERIKSSQPVENLSIDELVDLTSRLLRPRLEQLSRNPLNNPDPVRQEKPGDENQRLSLEKDRLHADLQKSRDRQEELEGQIRSLQNELSALQQVNAKIQHKERQEEIQRQETISGKPQEPGQMGETGWLAEWEQKGTSKRDAEVIRLLGETGLSRRPEIEARMGQLLAIKEDSGSIRACLTRLEETELISLERPWKDAGTGAGGRYPDLVRLTDRGQALYAQLFGHSPVPSEFDRLKKIHVSPEHTLLNLQVIEFLKGTDYQVVDISPEIRLDEGRIFCPDLVLKGKDHQTIYVEVERGISKSADRGPKWENFRQASGGHLYVICDNRTAMRNVRGEIVFHLRPYELWTGMTNLADLLAGIRGKDGSIWIDVRYRPAGKEAGLNPQA